MTAVESLAPAKVNLTLHVTGRRADGYHLLDSLVVFADMGDRLTLRRATQGSLRLTGPMAAGVPEGSDNLVLRAAALMGLDAGITLEKHLPLAAGLGGGSSDAAACLRGLSALCGIAIPGDVSALGADVPVCLVARAARMRGAGERVAPIEGLPALEAVLVNPRVAVPTREVFARLEQVANAAMPEVLPAFPDAAELIAWLATQRNDLEAAAIAGAPVIAQVLERLAATPGCALARMSGSGATCFGLYTSAETARAAALRLAAEHPGWWVVPVRLS